MTDHTIGTREEWLAARLELLEAEKELTRRGDELAQQRQELPWVRIEKEYRFEMDEGGASLADLFRGRSQLLIYHFMLGPDAGFVEYNFRTHDVRPTLEAGKEGPAAEIAAGVGTDWATYTREARG